MFEISRKLLFAFLCLSLIGLLLLVPLLATHRFIILSILPLGGIIYLVLSSKKIGIKFIQSDIGWLIFLIASFCSYFWAVNGSLVWYPAFGSLSLIIWMLCFRTISSQETARNYLSILFIGLLFIFFLYFLFCSFNLQLNENTNWNIHFGYNPNYTAIYTIILLPFLLFYSTEAVLFKIFQWGSLFLISYIIFKASAIGAMGILNLLVLYFFWIKGLQQFSWCLSAINILAILCILFQPIFLSEIALIQELKDFVDATRIYMFNSSLNIFLENPFLGIGLGNCQMEAYKENLSNIFVLNNPFVFFRLNDHNFYSQQLAELGTIGFLSFFLPIGIGLYQGWNNQSQLNDFQKAAYTSLLVYLLAALIYRDINIYEGHFSGIQLIAFCCLGVLTNNNTYSSYTLSKKQSSLLLTLPLASFIWFTYFHHTQKIYESAINLAKKDTSSIQLLESIYHPSFKTTHGFYRGHMGINQSIALEIAQRYQVQKKYNKAEEYYQKALQHSPNDEYILVEYANFLLYKKQSPDIASAKKYLLQIYKIQTNHVRIIPLLIDIAFLEKQYTQVRKYLNTNDYRKFRLPQLKSYERRLYASDYLDQLVKLTTKQKNILSEMANKNQIDSKLISLLTEKQLNLYLKDKMDGQFNHTVAQLTDLLQLNNNQQIALLVLFRDIGIKQEYVKRKLHLLSMANNVEEEKNYYEGKQDSLSQILHNNCAVLLSKEQYKLYKDQAN